MVATQHHQRCPTSLRRFAPSCVLRLKHACANEAASRSTSSPSPSPVSLHSSTEDSSLEQPQQLQHHPLVRLCSILESIHYSQASLHL
ncbi:hypothetical protein EYF80_036285 [Liparis tanakae]|uniref:Uncharacterized protein n=1 Tax=Liparis tanakae TaxID=230148 RepID=A0A4Z2GLJ7_9TELE|nr:hypothetical protein EYF80_036285 [Liparis tanakae]